MRTDAGPDRLVLTAWGRTLAVEVPAGRLATLAILPRLPFGWRPASDHGVAERTWTLVAGGGTVLVLVGRMVPHARELALRPRDDEGRGSRGGCPSRNGAAGPGGGVHRRPRGPPAPRPQPWLAVQPLTAGGVVLVVLDGAVAARSRPLAVLDAVTAAARSADGLAGSRGEAAEAAAALLAQLRSLP